MGNKLTIEEMQKIAKERGGICLSKKYIGAQSKLEWQCSKGHVWKAIPEGIKNRGWWCPTCAGKAKLSIEKIREVAEKRGGKCLSKKYINADAKYEWECEQGHRWSAAYYNIQQGQWCPQCNQNSYSEEICRLVFEEIFNDRFIKFRPNWLINKRGNKMELDGYSKKLKFAFEYQGQQHLKKNYFNQYDESKLKTRISDDTLKKNLCSKKGIYLFIITYLDNLENLPNIIKEKMIEFKLPTNSINFDKEIDFNKVYRHKNFINELQILAKNNQGKLLSTKYITSRTKLKWRCSEGHEWYATPDQVKRGRWCKICGFEKTASSKRLGIKLFKDYAKEKGGECLSENYTSLDSELEFKCKNGHVWTTTGNSIRNGSWCAKCSGKKKLTIEQLQVIASNHGGELLSKKYKDNKQKLKWKCSKGHIFFNIANRVKNKGIWCQQCKGH